jgi:hypothetical protein
MNELKSGYYYQSDDIHNTLLLLKDNKIHWLCDYGWAVMDVRAYIEHYGAIEFLSTFEEINPW